MSVTTLKLNGCPLPVQLFANVKQDLSDRICRELQHPTVMPLVFPEATPVKFKIKETWPNNSL